MKAFNRYFILYFIISVLVFTFVIIMNYFTSSNLNKPIFLITLSLSLFIFSFLMSLLFSSYSKADILKVYPQNEDELCMIESFFIDECGRKQVKREENKKEFAYKNKIKKWLTEPMYIISKNDSYIVYIPSYYSEKFKKKFVGMLCRE